MILLKMCLYIIMEIFEYMLVILTEANFNVGSIGVTFNCIN